MSEKQTIELLAQNTLENQKKETEKIKEKNKKLELVRIDRMGWWAAVICSLLIVLVFLLRG